MAGSDSDYLEDVLLDHVLGADAYTPDTPLFIALYSVAPSDAGGGTEFSAGNYARLSVTNNLTNFPAASGGAKSNGTSFDFPVATGTNWGNCVAVGIHDAVSAGNLLKWATVDTAKDIDIGDTAKFPIGSLDFTHD